LNQSFTHKPYTITHTTNKPYIKMHTGTQSVRITKKGMVKNSSVE